MDLTKGNSDDKTRGKGISHVGASDCRRVSYWGTWHEIQIAFLKTVFPQSSIQTLYKCLVVARTETVPIVAAACDRAKLPRLRRVIPLP
jgi:hypothetical protein